MYYQIIKYVHFFPGVDGKTEFGGSMKRTYSNLDLRKLDDRFENEFSLTFEIDTLPKQVEEMCLKDFNRFEELIYSNNYKLIISIPCIPVLKILKNLEIIEENNSFKLVKVTKQNFNIEIKQFLIENEFSVIFFLLKEMNKISFVLPKTSGERIKLHDINRNVIYYFQFEFEVCTIITWE